MSLLANPGFHSTSNTDFLGDYYTPDMVAVSRGLENIEINYTEPTHPHTHVSENFMPHEDENADHIADTFANCSDEGSEPDEVEFPIPPENGPNDVDINVIAEEFARGQVKCNPTFAIKHVIQAVKDHTGYDIPYQKAWYSLKMAREIVYGTWESSVQKLPKYMGAVQKYNPGTIVEWKHKALHPTGAYVIGYKHKMLIAATMDGNQQVLPLAFAIVDDESYASWKWFLQQLSRHVIRGRRGVCLISDRHAGIIKAVNESSEFVPPNGVHRYCLRHVCSNFNSHHKNIVLKDLCWRAGSEYQIRKFNRIMEEIKGQKLEAFTFLDRINKEKWTASHDGGWRCGILTTNMSECINGVLKGARRLPVTAIVEITLQRTAHYFRERALRSGVMLSNGQLWTILQKRSLQIGEKNLLLIQSRNTITCNNPPRSLQNANKDLDSTPMLSNLLTGNVHAANGINLVSLALTLKKYPSELGHAMWEKNIESGGSSLKGALPLVEGNTAAG
ncbi:UNVERIFIED_CONTAM: hypothetical protein Sradi_5399600 [Sesamum radiatum]|uniref:MULE transposase domain-containing protein n=1 Tax=Sesamum radiatum TaxID=300843 RepID=A0AAW2LT82_SESRA